MVFSSPIFLFLFLPITLLLYYVSPNVKIRNIVLLITSLLFYSWGEPDLVVLMVIMIIINYFIGKKIESKKNYIAGKRYLLLGIIINLLSLVYFKYANFIIENVNVLLNLINVPEISIKKVRLPIGISFFTFQSISYLIDVFRAEVKAQRNVLYLGLYISLFPQLIAGPIVRYRDIAKQITDRSESLKLFYSGVKRFIEGLGKKVIIANTVGYFADQVFALPPHEISSVIVLWGAILYGLQIYFDFSGYSDMAIGLGRMFGFRLLENFNFPYIATSVKEFWRRWHISLSTWFRDYLYIPLGGNRITVRKTYINLTIVFLVTGLWHGASWNFILWGALHGLLLVLERLGLDNILKKLPKSFQRFYVLAIVTFGWILFRSNDLEHFAGLAETLFSFTQESLYDVRQFINVEVLFAVLLGILFSFPWKLKPQTVKKKWVWSSLEIATYFIILSFSVLSLSADTYNPFIYFQF